MKKILILSLIFLYIFYGDLFYGDSEEIS